MATSRVSGSGGSDFGQSGNIQRNTFASGSRVSGLADRARSLRANIGSGRNSLSTTNFRHDTSNSLTNLTHRNDTRNSLSSTGRSNDSRNQLGGGEASGRRVGGLGSSSATGNRRGGNIGSNSIIRRR